MIGSPQYHTGYMRHGKTDKCNRSTKCSGYGGQQAGYNQKPVTDIPYIYAQILGIANNPVTVTNAKAGICCKETPPKLPNPHII